MRVVVLNCGSSSLKFCYADVAASGNGPPSVHKLRTGTIEGIGGAARWSVRDGSAPPREGARVVPTHQDAVRWLADAWPGLAVDGVGHRIVHGGARFHEPALLSPSVLTALERFTELAPLHNPPALAAIRAAQAWLGEGVPMTASFDTAFHHSMPESAALYALPRAVSARHQIRRYGFHGIAHASMVRRYAETRGLGLDRVRVITVHLGHGCSMTAIREGRSIDTSMGFTPLEGLVMGTRSGDLDPSLIGYLAAHELLDVAAVERLLNEQSGLLGLSELSGDMKVLQSAADGGHRQAALAIQVFCYRAKKYLGAYLAALGGADAVVFGGGIGERSPFVRAAICDGMAWCGLTLDQARNAQAVEAPGEGLVAIAPDDARIAAYVAAVDEEDEIARDTWRVLHQDG